MRWDLIDTMSWWLGLEYMVAGSNAILPELWSQGEVRALTGEMVASKMKDDSVFKELIQGDSAAMFFCSAGWLSMLSSRTQYRGTQLYEGTAPEPPQLIPQAQ